MNPKKKCGRATVFFNTEEDGTEAMKNLQYRGRWHRGYEKPSIQRKMALRL
ncbi:hypothetical protein DPMN_071877 [Dreissena polymorpha]|uniref:Uncharacterized protein n=1 Tax=Dreissena polymorpha TaxID=45954 RepID=A0A9D3Z5C2_DREPO|nr:hypothetical protein DPMN_071877 [Dreissena polymorpha]